MGRRSLAEDSDGVVASANLGFDDPVCHSEHRAGLRWLPSLWPIQVLELSHSAAVPRSLARTSDSKQVCTIDIVAIIHVCMDERVYER